LSSRLRITGLLVRIHGEIISEGFSLVIDDT